jgi:4-carboxymuconolactone decarboxylase
MQHDAGDAAGAPATDAAERIEARHDEVLGGGPRLAPVDKATAADSVRISATRLIGAMDRPPTALAVDRLPEIMFTMCRVPDLWNRLIDLTVQLQGANSVLPARDRKLAILRTGWLCQAPYEFGEHVKQAKRMGFTSEEVARVVAGSSAPEWEPHERAILRAVEELHERAMVSDATWDQLGARFDEAQLIELLVLIGQFTATAYLQNSLRLRLEKGNEGLRAS